MDVPALFRSFVSQLLMLCPPSSSHSSRHVAPGIQQYGAQVLSGILVVTARGTLKQNEQEVLGERGGVAVLNKVSSKVPKCPVERLSLADKEIRGQSTGLFREECSLHEEATAVQRPWGRKALNFLQGRDQYDCSCAFQEAGRRQRS